MHRRETTGSLRWRCLLFNGLPIYFDPIFWATTVKCHRSRSLHICHHRNPSSKLARWAMYIHELNLKIQHRPGKSNLVADALSRHPLPVADMLHVVADARVEDAPENDSAKLQQQDDELAVAGGRRPASRPSSSSVSEGRTFQLWDHWSVVLPSPKCTWHCVYCGSQLFAFHSVAGKLQMGSLPSRRSMQPFERGICGEVWGTMFTAIESLLSLCLKERAWTTSTPKVAANLCSWTLSHCWHGCTSTDMFSWRKSVCYCICQLLVCAVPDQTADTIAWLLVKEIVSRHWLPDRLLSDCGPNFLSSLIEIVCQLLGTTKAITSGYHPHCDGTVEKFNSRLINMLCKSVGKYGNDWNKRLPSVLFVYRFAVQDSTKSSLFYLLYGRCSWVPADRFSIGPSSYCVPHQLWWLCWRACCKSFGCVAASPRECQVRLV